MQIFLRIHVISATGRQILCKNYFCNLKISSVWVCFVCVIACVGGGGIWLKLSILLWQDLQNVCNFINIYVAIQFILVSQMFVQLNIMSFSFKSLNDATPLWHISGLINVFARDNSISFLYNLYIKTLYTGQNWFTPFLNGYLVVASTLHYLISF